MKVRSASRLDVSALVSLNRYVQELHAAAVPALFRSRPPEAEVTGIFHDFIEDPVAVWLVAEEATLCGYLYAQFHDRPESWFRPACRVCNINHLVVHPRRGAFTPKSINDGVDMAKDNTEAILK